jgi:hypothetical protein
MDLNCLEFGTVLQGGRNFNIKEEKIKLPTV